MAEDSAAQYLIVGGGLAAAKAVDGILEVDPEAAISVVTAEPHPPYERPPLSKGVLLGKDEPQTVYPHDEHWYAKHGVNLHLGDPAMRIDADAHRVQLASGAELTWDRLLIATGSRVRLLDVPGADLVGVHYLRTLADSLALLEQFTARSDVVVIGAGWIGLEVAAAAQHHKCRVTVLEPQAAPLAGVLGDQIGGWFARLHREHGVDLRLGAKVAQIVGSKGAVAGVVTEDGVTIPADLVVIGVGIVPETSLAETAGVRVENGLVTDSALRTSVEGIWAAGDVASWKSECWGRQLRVEHWANAHDGGLAAGRSMAGAELVYDPLPFFYSDQYDAGLEYAGYVARDAASELIIRGGLDEDAFVALWAQPDGDRVRLLAGLQVNTWDVIDHIQKLIRDRTPLDRDQLANPGVSLADLAEG